METIYPLNAIFSHWNRLYLAETRKGCCCCSDHSIGRSSSNEHGYGAAFVVSLLTKFPVHLLVVIFLLYVFCFLFDFGHRHSIFPYASFASRSCCPQRHNEDDSMFDFFSLCHCSTRTNGKPVSYSYNISLCVQNTIVCLSVCLHRCNEQNEYAITMMASFQPKTTEQKMKCEGKKRSHSHSDAGKEKWWKKKRTFK